MKNAIHFPAAAMFLFASVLWVAGEPAGESGIASRLSAAAKDLSWENVARIIPIESERPVADAVTPASVLGAFAAAHDRLMGDGSVWGAPNDTYMKLAARTSSSVDFEKFFKPLVSPPHPGEAAQVAIAAKFAKLRDVLKTHLTDIQVIFFNENPDRSDPITSSIFIVGKTADGKLAGVLTGSAD